MSSLFLTAEWKNLIMANYSVDPEILKSFLPAKTELDFFNEKTFVSLVGFQFNDTRIRKVRIPFHVNFLEVNLRFYVRHKDGSEWKRGTVFISEIVPRAAITFVANTLYHENYRTMPMNHSLKVGKDETEVSYHWKQNKHWNSLEVIADSTTVPMNVGSEEEFIAEHYWGYSKQRNNITYEYGVGHPRWQVYPVRKYSIKADFAKLYGSKFAFLKDCVPSSVFFAEGSAISVYSKRKL